MKSEPKLELQALLEISVPYWETLGLELKEVGQGRAVFEVEVRPGLLQKRNVVHGGVMASIADSACAVAGMTMVFPENYVTTINLQVAYLRPVADGRIRAEGVCVRAGRAVVFSEARIWDARETLVCTATSQLMVLTAKG
jgi:uncharacterized protein (TIGR00369 family)